MVKFGTTATKQYKTLLMVIDDECFVHLFSFLGSSGLTEIEEPLKKLATKNEIKMVATGKILFIKVIMFKEYLNFLWGQPIKLIQTVSYFPMRRTSKILENS